MMYKICRLIVNVIFIFALFILIFSWIKKDKLPPKEKILSSVKSIAPIQEKTDINPFDVTTDKMTYTVKPLYHYQLYGLVVSYHNSDSFFDYYHDKWNDNLNIRDLGMIWGGTAGSGIYKDITFTSGDWTLYYKWTKAGVRKFFSGSEVSNNHILAKDPKIVEKIMAAEIGDQIMFKGYLCEYSHSNGKFKRGTSTSRDDTGGRACETIFVKEFKILKATSRIWLDLFFYAKIAIAFCIISRIFIFFKEPFECKY